MAKHRLLLGVLLLAVIIAAAADGESAEKPAGEKPAEATAQAKAEVPADGAKKDAGAKLASKEAAEGGDKAPSASSGARKPKPDIEAAKRAAGKFERTEEERKKYSKMTPEERRAEREARMSERDRTREAKMEERRRTKEQTIEKTKNEHEDRRKKMEHAGHPKPNRAGPQDHMMNEFRGTAGMFMALVAPVKPIKVTFPLDEDTRLKFSAARDGLMKSVRKTGADLDVKDEKVKKDLRSKTKSNQEKTLDILLEAVKEGMTVQEARMGMVIAQFEALDDATKKEAMDKARQRQERMPSGARAKMNERLELKNKKERDQLSALKTDQEKEDFVKRIYRPRYNMATS